MRRHHGLSPGTCTREQVVQSRSMGRWAHVWSVSAGRSRGRGGGGESHLALCDPALPTDGRWLSWVDE